MITYNLFVIMILEKSILRKKPIERRVVYIKDSLTLEKWLFGD